MSTPTKSSSSLFHTEKAKVIYVFGNGDKYEEKGWRVLIHPLKDRFFDQLMTEFSLQLKLPTGPVRRIIDQENTIITSMDQFKDQGKYLCCGPEKILFEALPPGFVDGYCGKGTPVKIVTPRKQISSTPSTPSSADKSKSGPGEKVKNIAIFPGGAGYKHHDGVSLVIHSKKFKTLDQVKENLGRALGTPVKKIYDVNGNLIKSLDDFEDSRNYVCLGGEPFVKDDIPHKALSTGSPMS